MAETRGQGYLNTYAAYNAGKLDEAIKYAQAEAKATLEKQKAYRELLTSRLEEIEGQIGDYEKLIENAQSAEYTGQGEIRDDLINSLTKLYEIRLSGQRANIDAAKAEASAEIELRTNATEMTRPSQSLLSHGEKVIDSVSEITAGLANTEDYVTSALDHINGDVRLSALGKENNPLAATSGALNYAENLVAELNARAKVNDRVLTADEIGNIYTAVKTQAGADPNLNTATDVENAANTKMTDILERIKIPGAGVSTAKLEQLLTQELEQEFGVKEEETVEDKKEAFFRQAIANDGKIDEQEGLQYFDRFVKDEAINSIKSAYAGMLERGEISQQEHDVRLANSLREYNSMPQNQRAGAGGAQATQDFQAYAGDPIMMRYMQLGQLQARRGTTEQKLFDSEREVPRYEDIMQRAGEIHQQQYVSPKRSVGARKEAAEQAEMQVPREQRDLYRAHVQSRRMLEESQGVAPTFDSVDENELFSLAETFSNGIMNREDTLDSLWEEAGVAAESLYGRNISPESRQYAKEKYATYVMFNLNRAEPPPSQIADVPESEPAKTKKPRDEFAREYLEMDLD